MNSKIIHVVVILLMMAAFAPMVTKTLKCWRGGWGNLKTTGKGIGPNRLENPDFNITGRLETVTYTADSRSRITCRDRDDEKDNSTPSCFRMGCHNETSIWVYGNCAKSKSLYGKQNRTKLDFACAKHKMKSIYEECNKTDECNDPEKVAITYPTETTSTATTTMMMNVTSPNRNKTIYNSGTTIVASGNMVLINVVILCIMIKIGYEAMDSGAAVSFDGVFGG